MNLETDHHTTPSLRPPAFDRPLAEFILKVASRCNLNCTYCYMYNLGDDSWKRQPTFMSDKVLNAAVDRFVEHAIEHKLPNFRIILHGGEPFLAGPARLDRWCTRINQAFASTSTNVSIGLQSNALLFTPEIGDVLLKHGVRFGVSIDGIPGVSDHQRVDHKGNPVGLKLHRVLEELCSSKYKELLGGFIGVIDTCADPVDTLKYLLQFDPPFIDLRPPTDNHERLPLVKQRDPYSTEIGRWYEQIFDYMLDEQGKVPTRLLNGFVHGLVGSSKAQYFLGNQEIWAGVVEADGSLELVDNLKTSANGMTKTGLSVFETDLNRFSAYISDWLPTVGLDCLPEECKECPLEPMCGGGFYARRYSPDNGFRNPDVFCNDWKYLLPRMHAKLRAEMSRSELMGVGDVTDV